MADDGATRTRRWKAHKSGDHSMCRRCDPREPMDCPSGSNDPNGTPNGGGSAGPCMDPAGALARLAGRLEAAHMANPGNALLARELRATLLAMPTSGSNELEVADPLEELHAIVRAVP